MSATGASLRATIAAVSSSTAAQKPDRKRLEGHDRRPVAMSRRDEEVGLHAQEHRAQVEIALAPERQKAGEIRQGGAGHTQPVQGLKGKGWVRLSKSD